MSVLSKVLTSRTTLAQTYSPEEIEMIGAGIIAVAVVVLGLIGIVLAAYALIHYL